MIRGKDQPLDVNSLKKGSTVCFYKENTRIAGVFYQRCMGGIQIVIGDDRQTHHLPQSTLLYPYDPRVKPEGPP